ncbi:MAG: YceI family protein [Acidimicrobiales bacterium]|jgi:polyisoprenoid-binding protein YceI
MTASTTSIDLPALIRDAAGEWTLDPNASSVEFHVKHFWGVMTVHGHFETFGGDGKVDADGTVSGEIRIAADSVNTKNKQRDKHLRSDDFFDAEHHPTITISASGLTPSGGQDLRGPVKLSTAGHELAVDTVVHVVSATAGAVTLRAEATIDRTAFDMTWSPLKMTAPEARAVVTARFVRN